MDGKLRNMTAIYLFKGKKVLLLYRQGGRVVNNVWTGSAGGHFENNELNDAKACVLRELNEELGLQPEDIDGLTLRYITLRSTKGEINSIEMPFTAKYVIEHYCKIGYLTNVLYVGVASPDKVDFCSLPEF